MTARQVWEGMLTELSKTNSPSLLLHEFNYYFNKAINQYINKRYNIYDISQQTTDDLRVLKATAILKPVIANGYDAYKTYGAGAAGLFAGTYEVNLPDDYLHMLNCVCIYKMTKNHKCYNKGDYVDFPAKRLTADAWSVILNDYYNRPLPERPYYYIHNVNTTDEEGHDSTTVDKDGNRYEALSNPVSSNENGINVGVDMAGLYDVRVGNSKGNTTNPTTPGAEVTVSDTDSAKLAGTPERVVKIKEAGKNPADGQTNFDRVVKINGFEVSTVEREAGYRYGNASKVRCEIRYGRDNSVYQLQNVFIDYIKAPQVIRLTKEQVDLTEDTSQIMEFPDYVCQEIINELTTLIMQRDADPRLQTQTAVTQSIANPAQQQAPQQQQPQQRG